MLALLAARQRGAKALEVEDLLVALIVEDQGGPGEEQAEIFGRGPSPVLRPPWRHAPFISPKTAGELLARVDALRPRSQPLPGPGELPLSAVALRILGRATFGLGSPRRGTVGPLHLLSAIVSDEEPSDAARLLREAGLTFEELQVAIIVEAMSAPEGRAVATPAAFQPRNRNGLVIALARLRAWMRDWPAVTPEDALAAIIIEDRGREAILERFPEVRRHLELFERLDAEPHRPFLGARAAAVVLADVDALSSEPDPALVEEAKTLRLGVAVSSSWTEAPAYRLVPLSEALRRALVATEEIRKQLRHVEPAPAHLLAAIAADQSCQAGRILRDAGITPSSVVSLLRQRQQEQE